MTSCGEAPGTRAHLGCLRGEREFSTRDSHPENSRSFYRRFSSPMWNLSGNGGRVAASTRRGGPTADNHHGADEEQGAPSRARALTRAAAAGAPATTGGAHAAPRGAATADVARAPGGRRDDHPPARLPRATRASEIQQPLQHARLRACLHSDLRVCRAGLVIGGAALTALCRRHVPQHALDVATTPRERRLSTDVAGDPLAHVSSVFGFRIFARREHQTFCADD